LVNGCSFVWKVRADPGSAVSASSDWGYSTFGVSPAGSVNFTYKRPFAA
jgi:hypothetical protein